jgi:hypothetical protein
MLWRLIVVVSIVIAILALASEYYVMHKTAIHEQLSSMKLFVWANLAEALLWGGMGVGFAIRAVCLLDAKRDGSGVATLAAVTLIAFGVSDLVEATTGAWWRPWWLLLWKGLCVGLLLALIVKHIITRRNLKRNSPPIAQNF